jgi:hypothetical protein
VGAIVGAGLDAGVAVGDGEQAGSTGASRRGTMSRATILDFMIGFTPLEH